MNAIKKRKDKSKSQFFEESFNKKAKIGSFHGELAERHRIMSRSPKSGTVLTVDSLKSTP